MDIVFVRGPGGLGGWPENAAGLEIINLYGYQLVWTFSDFPPAAGRAGEGGEKMVSD